MKKSELVVPEVLEPEHQIPGDLRALLAFARLMDEAVAIPGTKRRIGLDAALGFIPGFGDAVGALMSTWIVFGALRHRVPMRKIGRMLVNIGLDLVVGAIPFLGDIFDIVFTENVQNAHMVIQHRDRARAPRTFIEILFSFSVVILLVLILCSAVIVWLVWTVASWRYWS